jgi:hypothetical protein
MFGSTTSLWCGSRASKTNFLFFLQCHKLIKICIINSNSTETTMFKFTNPEWRITALLSKLSSQLGENVQAHLHQLLINEAGATPKLDIKPQQNSLAKLIIQLSSHYTGGNREF